MIQLAPVTVPKASDVLAAELRERILSSEFTEGAALPPERELVVQTQMSRATVREALRILEVQGLVRIKIGRGGGAFVQLPGKDSVASSVNLLIRGRKIRLSSLLETREAIEPYCARLAAVHRTDDDLAVLDAANRTIADEGSTMAGFLQANVDWHVAVATAGHNELLAGLMTALSRAIYTATENERFVNTEVRRVAARAHRSITDAIRAQDPEAAARRMTRHVHGYADAALKADERTEITVDDR
ncbi:GntR family transcriptional regulator [Streptomyces fuscichromogenes]|uniref:GntR family transcriptional regulator n=1 Tax=Streptomyces fuscichromogenes TaxID=1324013 RepID=A0A917XCP6_9ACTN|nr:GntR family transcriptional regulator [Streptomyces fuscichromogenes]